MGFSTPHVHVPHPPCLRWLCPVPLLPPCPSPPALTLLSPTLPPPNPRAPPVGQLLHLSHVSCLHQATRPPRLPVRPLGAIRHRWLPSRPRRHVLAFWLRVHARSRCAGDSPPRRPPPAPPPFLRPSSALPPPFSRPSAAFFDHLHHPPPFAPLQMLVVVFVKQFTRNLLSSFVPCIQSSLRSTATSHDELRDTQKLTHEMGLPPPRSTYWEFNEMAIQYGCTRRPPPQLRRRPATAPCLRRAGFTRAFAARATSHPPPVLTTRSPCISADT